MDNLYIKGPRQQRAISTLLAGPITVKDMGPKIGALNPRQVIFELRCQGFNEIIKTRRFTTIDQDGKKCRPGEYYIPEKLKPMVELALKECIAKAATKRSCNIEKTHAHNIRRTL